MAKLYATSPNGTAKSIKLETMNIESGNGSNWYNSWMAFPNGVIIQWGQSFDTPTQSDGSVKLVFPISYTGKWYYRLVCTMAPTTCGQASNASNMSCTWSTGEDKMDGTYASVTKFIISSRSAENSNFSWISIGS